MEVPAVQTVVPKVLANRVLPRSGVVTVLLVTGFAALTAVAAQFEFFVDPIPVPFTLQTFAVLLAGGVLGMWAGAASQVVYLLVGSLGLPVYSGGAKGVEHLSGATGGYLIGFVIAAAVVGRLAERKHDRRFSTALSAFIVGSAIIYAAGVAGLMLFIDMGFGTAVANGVVPFVFWDLIKAAAAGLLLPITWRLLGDR
jgi:biotin transport system substrate-specific component